MLFNYKYLYLITLYSKIYILEIILIFLFKTFNKVFSDLSYLQSTVEIYKCILTTKIY